MESLSMAHQMVNELNSAQSCIVVVRGIGSRLRQSRYFGRSNVSSLNAVDRGQ